MYAHACMHAFVHVFMLVLMHVQEQFKLLLLYIHFRHAVDTWCNPPTTTIMPVVAQSPLQYAILGEQVSGGKPFNGMAMCDSPSCFEMCRCSRKRICPLYRFTNSTTLRKKCGSQVFAPLPNRWGSYNPDLCTLLHCTTTLWTSTSSAAFIQYESFVHWDEMAIDYLNNRVQFLLHCK